MAPCVTSLCCLMHATGAVSTHYDTVSYRRLSFVRCTLVCTSGLLCPFLMCCQMCCRAWLTQPTCPGAQTQLHLLETTPLCCWWTHTGKLCAPHNLLVAYSACHGAKQALCPGTMLAVSGLQRCEPCMACPATESMLANALPYCIHLSQPSCALHSQASWIMWHAAPCVWPCVPCCACKRPPKSTPQSN